MFNESIIKETIDYINSLDIKQEKKEYLTNILSSNDSSKINKLIMEDTLFIFTTPLIKEIYTNEKYLTNMMKLLSMQQSLFKDQYIQSFSKYIDLKDLFNQKPIIEFLKDSYGFENFYTKDLILKNINEDDRKIILENYYKNNKEMFLYKFFRLADCCILDAYNIFSEDFKSKLKTNFFEKYYSKGSEYLENFMWNEIKEEVKDKSVKEKINFLKEIESKDVKREIFNYFGFDKNLELVIDENGLNMSDFVSQDILFEKFKSLIPIDQYKPYFAVLDPDKQLEGIKILVQNKIPFYKYSYDIKIETFKHLYEISPKALDVSKLYELYKEYNDIRYLESIKEIYSKQDYYNLEILCEDDFVKLLNDDEKKIIAENLKGNGRITSLSFVKKINDYFLRVIAKDTFERLKNNPDMEANISLESLFKLYSEEEQLEVIRHIKLTTIISDAVHNEECFNNLMKLLNKNESLLHDLPNFNSLNTSIYLYGADNKRFISLLKYVKAEDLSLIISSDVIKNNEELKKYYFDNVLNNPSMVKDYELFEILPLNIKEQVVSKININLLKFYLYINIYMQEDIVYKNDFSNRDSSEISKEREILLKELYKRFDELVNYDNETTYSLYTKNQSNIYFAFDDEHKKMYIEKSSSINSLIEIVRLSNPRDELAINKLLKLYGDAIYEIDKYAPNKKIPFQEIDIKLKNYIISKMNFEELLFTYTYYQDNEILNSILNEIHKDSSCLISDISERNIRILLHLINQNEKDYIIDSLSNMLSKNELYMTKYKSKVKEFNVKDAINYLNIYKQGYIEDNQELVDKLLNNNPFLFKSVKNIIFNNNVNDLSIYFLNKLSKYNDLQYKLELVSKNKSRINVFNKIAKYLDDNIENKVVFDKEISEVIEFLSSSNLIKDEDLDIIDDYDIKFLINYILCNNSKTKNSLYQTVSEKYVVPYKDFAVIRENKCDKLFNETFDINEMKNIYFDKYFSISYSDALNFYQTYVMNYDKVYEYSSSDKPLLFINLLTKIININDPITIRELYMTNDLYFDLTDIYEIEAIMSHAYTRALSNDYKGKQKGNIVHKSIKDKDGNIEEYEMTELVDNFGIIVHSTCAYGQMPLIDDDYYSSWNYNPNTENHGICCSYITNTSYGTAAVTGTGVMLGFTNITPETVVAYSPYDLATYNNGFNIDPFYVPYYTKLDEISDYTRHTHNEFTLERRVNDGNNFCLQPNCIIIFEDMDDNIKANSIKAYKDFKMHNPDMKLVYIDRVKLANIESEKLDKMIIEYNTTKDLNLLKDIINKYESNLCCSDFLSEGNVKSKGLYDMNVIFKTTIISNLLIDTLNEITESKDKKKLDYFISILEHEQYKFNLIDDKNPDRKHTFKLYSDDLKKKIQESINILNKENTKVI